MKHWEGIIEFIAVIDNGSFTQAAEKLQTSVANISRRVNTLESRLAVKLLSRTTRKISPTEAGTRFYQQCKPLIEGIEQAQNDVTQEQLIPQGTLKLTAPVTYGEQKIAPLLLEFSEQYPSIQLDLILSNRKLDIIEQGIDLAIRLGQLEDNRLVAKKLASRSLHICASPTYLSRNGQPYTLSELNHHHCLIGTNDHWRFKDNNQIRNFTVAGKFRCNSGAVLLQAALQGRGIVQLPNYYVDPYLASGELVEVLDQFRDTREGIWAVYPQNRYLLPKVKLLINFLSEQLNH